MHGCTTSGSEEELNLIYNEACLAQTDGLFPEALAKYQLLLNSFPKAPILRYNLGLVYYSLGNFKAALAEFSLANRYQPDDSDTLFNLALCQKKSGDIDAAITSYDKSLELKPNNSDGWYNLGGCYRDSYSDDQAIDCYQKVLELDPHYLPAINNLAYIYHRSGDRKQAEIYYRQVIKSRPEDESAQYMLASLLGTPLKEAPDCYVRHFFDDYAEGFEKGLVEGLGYDTPKQLYSCFQNSIRWTGANTTYQQGLDLGCGTGLSGVAFKKSVKVLDGVDLSAKMLLQAAEKDCYDSLFQDSIIHYLQTTTKIYDFFVATDVFIYVGDLKDIFTAMGAISSSEALFCFSTESLDKTGYRLMKTGRFAYSRTYIENVAAVTGWTVLTVQETKLRKEREQWIEGDLWILQLKSQP